jgi:pyruvate/2-oxoglutarate/acetoin dehydrogenase E1 component
MSQNKPYKARSDVNEDSNKVYIGKTKIELGNDIFTIITISPKEENVIKAESKTEEVDSDIEINKINSIFREICIDGE